MKILIISDAWYPQMNGVVRTYENLSKELRKMGHEVKVIGPKHFKWKIPMFGYKEIRLCLFPYRRLSKLIKEFNPDAVHISVEGPLGWAGRKYCAKHNMKYSTAFHTLFPKYVEERLPKIIPYLRQIGHEFGRWYVKTFHRKANAIMVASPSLEQELRQWKLKNKIYRLTRGVNTDIFFVNENTNTLKDLKKPIALYVGRISIEKNLEDFLDMEWDGTKVIVGEGPYKEFLQEKYPDAVFMGKRRGRELANIYRSADVFVFPSKTDTFGIVIIEALACGLPVAAYNVMGPKDIIKEDYLGCLSENLSEAALNSVKNKNPQKSHKYVTENYTWQIAAEQFLNAIKDYKSDSFVK